MITGAGARADDNAQDHKVVIPMYNAMEFSDSYLKISGNVWQYHRDDLNDNSTDFESFKSK